MSQLYNKIFSEEGSLSKDELLAYLRDELSESERNRIEVVLESSALDREALEGLENSPESWAALEQLSMPEKLTTSSASSTTVWWAMGIAATLITVAFVWFLPVGTEPDLTAENNTLQQKKEATAAEKVLEESSAKNTEKIENTERDKPLSKETETVPTVTEEIEEPQPTQEPTAKATNAPIELAQNSTSTTIEEVENEPVLTDETAISSSQESVITTTSPAENAAISSTSIVEKNSAEEEITEEAKPEIDEDLTAYVNIASAHYKIVNYATVERLDSEKETLSNTEKRQKMLDELSKSTPPRYGNQDEVKPEDYINSPYTISLNYDFALESALEAFHKQNYSLAEQRFSLILNQFPQDQNALFYSALVSKFLFKMDLAEIRLRAVIEQEPAVFRPEAQWEIAQLLTAQDRLQEAKDWLTIIVEQRGFYAERAQELLSKIEK